ncbi:MAG: hypothetical protein A2X86_04180 [Bdellovibrionales bacterium GWA2_49_15]|nr:MAG: hypothetical protein A2X86_04180 [Bdellovibrionales bacterium GWA2_49_15]HAZ12796.1 hypothetical protein [Bdellovibrionales bacterium]
MTDLSGEFILERESGGGPKKNTHIVKRRVYQPGKAEKELEKSIAIADVGVLVDGDGEKTPVLKPKISQYTVWFESKKYFTEMKLDNASKSLLVNMSSPEAKWNGNVKVPFPKGTGVFCFFSQVIECIARTRFFELSANKNTGQLNIHIIWDGYPYFQEQYSNVPSEVFSRAQVVYEGRNEESERKYSIVFGGESIFFNIDEYENLSKIFWISQGLTIVRSDSSEVKSTKKAKKKFKQQTKESFGRDDQFTDLEEGNEEAEEDSNE